MNAFQHGVLHGLGWCLVSIDGWIYHHNLLLGAGLALIGYTLIKVGKSL